MAMPYTQDELTLCAYAALYDMNEFGGVQAIHRLNGRSIGSITMKISNMAAMLDEEGISRNTRISPLTGTPPGEPARRTNWELVERLSKMPKPEFQSLCRRIVGAATKI